MSKLKLNSNKLLLLFLIVGLFLYQIFDVNKYLNFAAEGQILAARIQDFLTLVLSIVIEAFPFIILGVVISVLVGIDFFPWVNKKIIDNKTILFPLYYLLQFLYRIDKKLHNNRVYSHVKISLMGVFLPVCECGNIPVARRLVMNGHSVSQSITFLLAAPILNPVTFITTAEAFSFDKSVVIIRMISGFVIANLIGIIISYKKNQNELLNEHFYNDVCNEEEHHHHHNKFEKGIDIFQSEFLEVMKVLFFGAALAALSQTFIPRDVIASIGQNPILSILAMIILAFVVSICSNVDAFFALSYSNSFTLGSLMSFLVFGPMIDIKILTMMKATYKVKVLVIVSILVFLASFLVGLMVNFFK